MLCDSYKGWIEQSTAIQQINIHQLRHPLDRNLSSGQQFPPFEQLEAWYQLFNESRGKRRLSLAQPLARFSHLLPAVVHVLSSRYEMSFVRS